MTSRFGSRFLVFLVGAECLCAGPAERIAATHWAHYYAVPSDLVVAIIEAESAWQPNAVSPKGAAGLMQLMPATAVAFGITNRFEIEQNVRAGVAYLAHLLTVFKRRCATGCSSIHFRRGAYCFVGASLFECCRFRLRPKGRPAL